MRVIRLPAGGKSGQAIQAALAAAAAVAGGGGGAGAAGKSGGGGNKKVVIKVKSPMSAMNDPEELQRLVRETIGGQKPPKIIKVGSG